MEFLKITKQLRSAMMNRTGASGSTSGVAITMCLCGGTTPANASFLDGVHNDGGVLTNAITVAGGTVLASMVLMNSSVNAFTSNAATGAMLVPDSPVVSAVASGLATWFVIYVRDNATARTRGTIMGQVSDLNGTGDLRLSDPSLVTGKQYRTSSFEIAIPYEMVF